MYEHRQQKLLSRPAFVEATHAQAATALILVVVSLAIGTVGFHEMSRQLWIDALLNSAMLLRGMGPVGDLHHTGHAGRFFSYETASLPPSCPHCARVGNVSGART
jgi:hypothetical protein